MLKCWTCRQWHEPDQTVMVFDCPPQQSVPPRSASAKTASTITLMSATEGHAPPQALHRRRQDSAIPFEISERDLRLIAVQLRGSAKRQKRGAIPAVSGIAGEQSPIAPSISCSQRNGSV